MLGPRIGRVRKAPARDPELLLHAPQVLAAVEGLVRGERGCPTLCANCRRAQLSSEIENLPRRAIVHLP
eukprot:10150012-Alexandrium_andersonii.AAC.1